MQNIQVPQVTSFTYHRVKQSQKVPSNVGLLWISSRDLATHIQSPSQYLCSPYQTLPFHACCNRYPHCIKTSLSGALGLVARSSGLDLTVDIVAEAGVGLGLLANSVLGEVLLVWEGCAELQLNIGVESISLSG